ncbi:MAG: pilus (MSHA type) biogenesis protein MshL [Sulfurimonas sp.]|nr:pilus (MSHA type) biogenesis protein MshL [Sulfurimonas sp.]
MKTLKSTIYGALLTCLLSTNVIADCSFELFSISSTKGTKIIDFVEQLSDECEFTIIVGDPKADKFLDSTLNKTHLKNLTINEVLDIVLKENNLSYTLENNILKISYLTTKVFSIDYILSTRKGSASTNIMLSSGGIADSSSDSSSDGSSSSSSSSSESGTKIESNDEVKFWEELDIELQSVLNRPHDSYIADTPIINKNAGLVTVTATIKQMTRFEKYLKRLQEKVQLQVLIDVQLLSVTMTEGKSTGVDWSQLYALQNINLTADYARGINVAEWTPPGLIQNVVNPDTSAKMLSIQGDASLNEVIKFLETQGDVSTLSNPKVLTLNNQPALITVGTEYFYKITSSETLAGGNTGTTSEDEEIESVFAGVLLDITPEIADDRTITLKINPSISEAREDMSKGSADRTMPPDLDRRQLSTVVTVKDGNRIILGGLINTKNDMQGNQVPLLGDIPVLGYLFKYEEKVKTIQELIIIIRPRIIDKAENKLSLKDLGYNGITDALFENNSSVSKKLVDVNLK